MEAANINLPAGQKADRKLEMIFVNTGTAGGPDYQWELQGRGVEDASIEYNHDVEQTTDILGMTDTDVSSSKPSMELDPNTAAARSSTKSCWILSAARPPASSAPSTCCWCTAIWARPPPAPLPPRSITAAPWYPPAWAAPTMWACP